MQFSLDWSNEGFRRNIMEEGEKSFGLRLKQCVSQLNEIDPVKEAVTARGSLIR